jgi:hypothetical protein
MARRYKNAETAYNIQLSKFPAVKKGLCINGLKSLKIGGHWTSRGIVYTYAAESYAIMPALMLTY